MQTIEWGKCMKNNEYEIHAFWDKEASVWVAESEDVKGLVTEAESFEMLHEKLKQLIPELLEANNIMKQAGIETHF